MYIGTQLVVVVRSDRLFTKLYRERELQWRIGNFEKRWRNLRVWVSGELRYRLMGLCKFIDDTYCTAFRSRSILRMLLVV